MLRKKKDYILGEELIRRRIMTLEEVDRGLDIQKESGEFLGQILIRLGYLNNTKLLEVLADQYGLEIVDLFKVKIPKSALACVPAKVVQHYRIVPVERNGNTLRIATSELPNFDVVQELSAVLGVELKIVLADRRQIDEAIERYYGVGASVVERMVESRERGEREGILRVPGALTEETTGFKGEASVRELVNQLLIDAKSKRASDIHIEPFEDELIVRYRIDGVLQKIKAHEEIRQFHSGIISRIKIMANMDISEHRIPQDGRVKVRVQGEELDLRLSLLATAYGEALVIRILAPARLLKLDKIGLSETNLPVLREILTKPHGVVLLTGPTGSGKTTTLYACLSELNDTGRKIITIEDPIEYQLRGIIQTQVHPKINVTFARGLRHMLRHDPDIMMVGEIRDTETAEIAIRSALTGHLVFSTLHTNDAPSALVRLLDLGMAPYLVGSSVACVIAQRLVRVICERCKIEVPAEKLDELQALKPQLRKGPFYQGTGCDACRKTGYLGRTAVHEFMVVDDEIRDQVAQHCSVSDMRRRLVEKGMKPLQEDGLEKVKLGITALSEILRITR